MMRGLETEFRKDRRKIYAEVARLGFEGNAETISDDLEALPYELVNEDTVEFRRQSFKIYRKRENPTGNGTSDETGGSSGTSDCRS